MTDSQVAGPACAPPQAFSESSDDCSSRGSASSNASPSPPSLATACILDGSAMSNPAIAAKFPRRQRRGSAQPNQQACPTDLGKAHHDSSSPSSCSESAAVTAGGTAAPERSSHERHPGNMRSSKHQSSSSSGSHSTSAKNPFAATPKNIRQQQLLCNLMAAADSFQEPHPSATSGTNSRGHHSIDYGQMPPSGPGAAAAAAAAGRPSLDMASMSRAASRTSLDSYGWGCMSVNTRGRSSCDMSARQSMESSYAGASMRSSMDHNGCWSGRPSVDSTFSCYAPVASPQLLAQQQQQAAATAAAAAAAAVTARASFEAALPPTPAGGAGLSRMGMWHLGRSSADLSCLASPGGASAFTRYSLDAPVTHERQAAAAAAAAASALQLEHQRSFSGGLGNSFMRYDNSGLVRYDSSCMSHVSSGSHDSGNGNGCPPSPATPAELAAAAADMAARQAQMAQLQQIIDSMAGINGAAGGLSADTAAALATLTTQGMSPDAAALLLLQAQSAGASSGSNNQAAKCCNRPAPEAVLFQQHLQQIMQANANRMAAAAASAAQTVATSQLYAAHAAHNQQSQQQQQQQQATQRWQRLGLDARETDLLRDQGAPLSGAVNASNLQQQLEMMQQLQL